MGLGGGDVVAGGGERAWLHWRTAILGVKEGIRLSQYYWWGCSSSSNSGITSVLIANTVVACLSHHAHGLLNRSCQTCGVQNEPEVSPLSGNTPHKGPNQNSRKLGAFQRKFGESYYKLYIYIDKNETIMLN